MAKKKRWLENLKGVVGLDYITFKRVPMIESEYGPVIDLPPGVLERVAAIAIVERRVPIRGLEVKFLRKSLGLSMERFAAQLSLTSGAVFKWERNEKERLHPANEAIVRAFFAEKLEIDFPGKLSQLIGTERRPSELILKAS